MKELVVATNNPGKLKEIREILEGFTILSLKDIGFTQEIDEPFETFEENAYAKAKAIFDYCGKNVISDDSGICANALGGKPGVHSAHYSGTRNDEENLQFLIENLSLYTDKSAYYIAVICLIENGQAKYFEGRCNGVIINEKRGSNGFGYDPSFVPNGYSKTIAELTPEEKNKISHRGKALEKLVVYLDTQ